MDLGAHSLHCFKQW